MKCIICWKMKLEKRINHERPADMIIEGHSMCKEHAKHISFTSAVLMWEQERERLREWWKWAEGINGPFDSKTQEFQNGLSYVLAGGQ